MDDATKIFFILGYPNIHLLRLYYGVSSHKYHSKPKV